MNIKEQYNSLKKKILNLQTKLAKLQNDCSHVGHSRIARCDVGNYDPNNDCYWHECECNDCGKRWRESQK